MSAQTADSKAGRLPNRVQQTAGDWETRGSGTARPEKVPQILLAGQTTGCP